MANKKNNIIKATARVQLRPCDYCGRQEEQLFGIAPAYCSICQKERQSLASQVFDTSPFTEKELAGTYVQRTVRRFRNPLKPVAR